jgi:hypothetical protein
MLNRHLAILLTFLLFPKVVASQDALPPEVRARAELSQTVAELVRVKSEWTRKGARTVQEMSRAYDEWSEANDKVGNFMLGYIVALLDRGVQILGTTPCTVNAVDLGEAAIDRMISAEDRWRDKWVEVLREWLNGGLLADPRFREQVCQPVD